MAAAAAAHRPRALIAGHDAALRSGLRRAIEPGVDCWEAAGAADALDVLQRESPDVCLLESDGEGGGLRLTELIHRARPDVQIVLLAETLDEGDFLRAVRAGACGYLLETVDPDRLPHIVEAVLRGEAAVPRALVGRLLGECRSP